MAAAAGGEGAGAGAGAGARVTPGCPPACPVLFEQRGLRGPGGGVAVRALPAVHARLGGQPSVSKIQQCFTLYLTAPTRWLMAHTTVTPRDISVPWNFTAVLG